MSLISGIFYGFRRLCQRKNERGEITADIFRLKVREKVRTILKNRQGLIIDLGCGEGYLLEKILTPGDLKAVLFDNSPTMMKIAAKNYFPALTGKAFFVLGDARYLPFRDSQFNLCTCLNTFYNLPSKEDVKIVIGEIALLLKPGGSLIFDIRNLKNPLVKSAYKKVKSYDPSIGELPLNAYSLKEIGQILNQAGLTMTKSSGLLFPLKSLAPILIIESRKLP